MAAEGASEWNGGYGDWSDAGKWSAGVPTDTAALKNDGHITLDVAASIDRWYQLTSTGTPDGWWWNKLYSDGHDLGVATSFDVVLGWGASASVTIEDATLTVGTDMNLVVYPGAGWGAASVEFLNTGTADVGGTIVMNNAASVAAGDNSQTLRVVDGAEIYAVGGMSINMIDGASGGNRGVLHFSATNSNGHGTVFLGRSADGLTTHPAAALSLLDGARLEVAKTGAFPDATGTQTLVHVVSPTSWSGSFEELSLLRTSVAFGDVVLQGGLEYALQRTALDGDGIANDVVLAVTEPAALSGEWAYRLMQASENATGMSFGFWCNYWRAPEALEVFGRRPHDRVGFHKWQQFETSAGVYDFGSGAFFGNDRLSHRCGSTTIASANFGSAPGTSRPGNDTLWIPGFYTPHIGDPVTRQAAEDALYAYVSNRLTYVGNTILIIDYEPMWNYDTTTTAGRQLFRDWFVDAAAVARQAAADLGVSDLLKIAVNVNGNPMATPSIVGGTNETWLLDAASAADIFTIDSYSFDANDPTNAETTLSVVEYWVEHYSLGKPVILTEVGFQSVLTVDPGYPGGYHAYGTEEEQAQYLTNLLQEMEAENHPGGRLKGQVRGLCIWSYADYRKGGNWEYFGLVRSDDSLKPAAHVAQTNFSRLAQLAFTRPSDVVEVAQYPGSTLSAPVMTVYESGTEHQFLRLTGALPEGAYRVQLHVETAHPGCMLLSANGTHWMEAASQLNTTFDFDLSGLAQPGAANTFDLHFTGDFFPCTQTVSQATFSYNRPAQLGVSYSDATLTVDAAHLPTTGTSLLQANTNLVEENWNTINQSAGSETASWDLSPLPDDAQYYRVLSVP